MPHDHARALRERTPMSRRERWLWASSAALLVIVVAVLILLTTGGKTKLGCVNTYLPGVIGSQSYDECGHEARQTCATVRASQRQFGTVGVLIIEKACHKGHLAVG